MDRIRYLIGLVTLATAGVLGFVLFQLLADENPDGYFPIRLEFADVRGLGPGAEVRYPKKVVAFFMDFLSPFSHPPPWI